MAVVRFQDLPLGDREREWDGDAAEQLRGHLGRYYEKMGDEPPWER